MHEGAYRYTPCRGRFDGMDTARPRAARADHSYCPERRALLRAFPPELLGAHGELPERDARAR